MQKSKQNENTCDESFSFDTLIHLLDKYIIYTNAIIKLNKNLKKKK